MSTRHLGRSVVLQTLFEWDFNKLPASSLPQLLAHNQQQFAPGLADMAFETHLLQGVLRHQGTIDTLIVEYAPEWPLAQITTVDRNVLRIGMFELVYDPSIPARVAIDEAIELAKSFGGPASGRFVNGVLGTMYKERMERGEVKEIDKEATSH